MIVETGPEPRQGGVVRPTARTITYGLGLAAGAVALGVALPRIAGAPWADITATAESLSLTAVLGLLGLWLAGLLSHTITLTRALPGLSHPRALMLSLSGSAVANVLPLGGAAGVALNYRMTSRWGFSRPHFAAYTVITNVWDVGAKLVLPLVVLPLLIFLPVPTVLRPLEYVGLALPAAALVVAVVLLSAKLLSRVGAGVDAVWRRVRRPQPGPPVDPPSVALVRLRTLILQVAQQRWRALSLGMVLYTALLLVLLWSCLHLTAAAVPLGVVVVAFCAERVVTLANLTPGGLGVVELGLVAVLATAPTSSAAGVATGVLLYRALTYGLEIPVGGLLLLGWELRTSPGRSLGTAR